MPGLQRSNGPPFANDIETATGLIASLASGNRDTIHIDAAEYRKFAG